MLRKQTGFGGIIFIALCLAGCAMPYKPAIHMAQDHHPSPESTQRLARAKALYDGADSLEKLNASIEAYQSVLSANPGDYEALVQLSNQFILLGTAHTSSRKEKSEWFRKAMTHAELAMYTNGRFRAAVIGGAQPWEAARMLDRGQIDAIFFWVTALQYEFKESMVLVSKIRNIDWMRHGLTFLDRVEEIDPDYGDGALAFAKAICYYVLPESKGGSKRIGENYMHQAVEKGRRRLLPRWGRGKYFYAVKGDKAKAREDLQWVATRPLSEVTDPYPWRVYFQQNARELIQ